MASAPTIIAPVRSAAITAGVAAVLAAALILFLTENMVVTGGFLAAGLVAGGAVIAWRILTKHRRDADERRTDWTLVRGLAQASDDAVAVTDRAGRLVCANDAFEAMFGGLPVPPGLPLDEAGVNALGGAGRVAWRDGEGSAERLRAGAALLAAHVTRAGEEGDMLIWRFRADRDYDLGRTVADLLTGETGIRLGHAGIMAALIAPDGRVRAANPVLAHRATGRAEGAIEGRDFARHLITDSRGLVRFEREGLSPKVLLIEHALA